MLHTWLWRIAQRTEEESKIGEVFSFLWQQSSSCAKALILRRAGYLTRRRTFTNGLAASIDTTRPTQGAQNATPSPIQPIARMAAYVAPSAVKR